MEWDDLLSQALIQKAQSDVKKRLEQKKKASQPEAMIGEELDRAIKDPEQWQTTRLVFLEREQHCTCGQIHRHQEGLFLERTHWTGARKLEGLRFLPQDTSLQPILETQLERITICSSCFLDNTLDQRLEAALSGYGHNVVQLPLFPCIPLKKLTSRS